MTHFSHWPVQPKEAQHRNFSNYIAKPLQWPNTVSTSVPWGYSVQPWYKKQRYYGCTISTSDPVGGWLNWRDPVEQCSKLVLSCLSLMTRTSRNSFVTSFKEHLVESKSARSQNHPRFLEERISSGSAFMRRLLYTGRWPSTSEIRFHERKFVIVLKRPVSIWMSIGGRNKNKNLSIGAEVVTAASQCRSL